MSNSQIGRRDFLVTGAGLAAAALAAPRRILGANERIGLGVIGCGSRGCSQSLFSEQIFELRFLLDLIPGFQNLVLRFRDKRRQILRCLLRDGFEFRIHRNTLLHCRKLRNDFRESSTRGAKFQG